VPGQVCGSPTAWLSLDDDDSDTTRFLTYLIAALRTATPKLCESTFQALQAEGQAMTQKQTIDYALKISTNS